MIGQIIRLRFLDPEAGAQVIAQKLRQMGMAVIVRSVERTITQYGLQKKLHQFNPDQTVPVQDYPGEQRPLLTLAAGFGQCDPWLRIWPD